MLVTEDKLNGCFHIVGYWLVEQVPAEGVVLADPLFMFFYGNGAEEATLLVATYHGSIIVFNFNGAEGELIHGEDLIFR